MQRLEVNLAAAWLTEGDLGLGDQVGQRRAQLVGNVGGKAGQPAEGILQARQHGIEGFQHRAHLAGHAGTVQALVERAGGNPLAELGQLLQRLQALTGQPGAEQGGGQCGQAHGQPDQALHLGQEMLVVADIQAQAQLRSVWLVRVKGGLQGAQLRRLMLTAGRLRLAAEPRLTLGAEDLQLQLRVAAQLFLQGRQAAVEVFRAELAAEQLAMHLQLAGQQLFIQFAKVPFTGLVEQQAGDQRDQRGAGGEQQCQAPRERNALQ